MRNLQFWWLLDEKFMNFDEIDTNDRYHYWWWWWWRNLMMNMYSKNIWWWDLTLDHWLLLQLRSTSSVVSKEPSESRGTAQALDGINHFLRFQMESHFHQTRLYIYIIICFFMFFFIFSFLLKIFSKIKSAMGGQRLMMDPILYTVTYPVNLSMILLGVSDLGIYSANNFFPMVPLCPSGR